MGTARACNEEVGSHRPRAAKPRWAAALIAVVVFSNVAAHAGQPLETETARLPRQGEVELEGAVEFQASTKAQGTETALPFAVEVGLLDSLSLLVEPVFLTAIRPVHGKKATGLGDLEMTLTWRFLDEREWWPALAVAGEVKVPTARNTLIGTGEADYSPYMIASKRFGNLDTHLNLGYGFLGSPVGVRLHGIITYGAAVEYHLDEHWDLLAEVIGNTSSSPTSTTAAAGGGGGGGETPGAKSFRAADGGDGAGGGGGVESSIAAEAAGAEESGLIGVRYRITPNLNLSFGVTYDSTGAVLLRPGITYKFSAL